MRRVFVITALIFMLPLFAWSQKKGTDSLLVEVSGVVATADSLLNIPGVSIYVKGKNRGTVANEEGVFSIVVERGDTLAFQAIGFKKTEVVVEPERGGQFLSLFLPLKQETTYLPPATVRSYPTREEFEDAFLHWKIPDDLYQLARANAAAEKLRAGMNAVPPDGGEGVTNTFRQRHQQMSSKGQMPTMNIFNPLSWAEFIKAVKDGDLKRKN